MGRQRGGNVALRPGVIAVAVLTVIVLAGCASGSAEEARFGQEQDGAARSVMAAEQATYTAQTFFPPTPSPGPAPPPPPILESIVITIGLGAESAPRGSYASVPADAGTIYAGALLHDLRVGQEITAIWTDADGSTIGSARVEIRQDAERAWVALPLRLNRALPAGEYAVYVFAFDRWLNSLIFSVTPPGSAPLPFPDPPTDPQVNSEPTIAPEDEKKGKEDENDRRRNEDGQPPDNQGRNRDDGSGGFEIPVFDRNSGEIIMVTRTP